MNDQKRVAKEKINECQGCKGSIGLGFTYSCGTPCFVVDGKVKMNPKMKFDHHKCPCDSYCENCALRYFVLDPQGYLRCSQCHLQK